MHAHTFTPLPWMDHAECAHHPDPDLWFPGSGSLAPLQIRAAKAVCAACPVTAECLQVAVSDPSLDGIWGGHTKPERARLNRRTCA